MRTSDITRETGETSIQIALNLDGHGNGDFETGVPFFRSYVRSNCSSRNV
jgi:imidazoleglycerol-phosphate dehydratase